MHRSVNKVSSKTMKTHRLGVGKIILLLMLFASCCDFIVATDERGLELRQSIGDSQDSDLSIRFKPDASDRTRKERTSPEKNSEGERKIRRERNTKHRSTDDVRKKPNGQLSPEKRQRRKLKKALKKRRAKKKRQRIRARKRMKKRKLRKKRRRIRKRKARKKRRSTKKRKPRNRIGPGKPREPKPLPSVEVELSPEAFEPPIPSPVVSEEPVSQPDSGNRIRGPIENAEKGVETETGLKPQADIDTESPLKVQLKPFGKSAGAGERGPRRVCYKIYVLQGNTIRHYRVKFRTAVPDRGKLNVKVAVGGCIARSYKKLCIKMTLLKKKSCADQVVKQCLGKKISLFEETSPDDDEKDSSSSKPKAKANVEVKKAAVASPSASPVVGKGDAK